MASSSRRVAETSTTHPEIEGSNPATANYKDKITKKIINLYTN
jgi:hypothetical protein